MLFLACCSFTSDAAVCVFVFLCVSVYMWGPTTVIKPRHRSAELNIVYCKWTRLKEFKFIGKLLQLEIMENYQTIFLSSSFILSLTPSLPLKRRLAKCAPPIPSCMLFSPTMPWGFVHLSVNMVSLKYDLIRLKLYLFPAGTRKHSLVLAPVSKWI